MDLSSHQNVSFTLASYRSQINTTATIAPVLRRTYLWYPAEPSSTCILASAIFDAEGTRIEDIYYTHDILKNTSALFGSQIERRALYEYGHYGNIVKIEGNIEGGNIFSKCE